MASVPVADVAEIELRYLWDGQQVEQTLYALFDGAIGVEDLNSLNSAVHNWWSNSLATGLSAAITLGEIVSTDLTTSTGVQSTLVISPAEAGHVNSEAVPNNVAIVVSLLTSHRGRSFRGRSYVPGCPRAHFAQSEVIEASRNNFETWYVAFGAALAAANWTHVVVSRFSGVDVNHKPIPRAEGVSTPVTGYRCNPVAASQRRRLPGRGR